VEQRNFYIPFRIAFPPPVQNISTALFCLQAIVFRRCDRAIADLLEMQQRLFSALQIGKSCPSDLGHFGGWVEIHQFLVKLLGMRDITLVFFEGGRFKQLLRLLIGAAEQHQTEGTEYKSCGCHSDPFQASLRRDTLVFV
jgi:hypothetical protein